MDYNIELLFAQQPHLDGFNNDFLNLNYPGITSKHLQRVYGQIIMNVVIEDIFALSESCILRFAELKLNSI